MKYRKKPVVIEAEQYKPGMEDGFDEDGIPYIDTGVGKWWIRDNDWLITDINGGRYPVKADIFEETYELVE